MKKRTRRKNIFRSILSSMNRFLSILFIVALGAGFMAGLAAASPDMYETADAYMDEFDWYDLDLKSTIGFTQEDLEAVRNHAVTAKAAGSVVLDMVLNGSNETGYTSRVYGMLKDGLYTDVNRLKLKEGRWPADNTECLIQTGMGKYFTDSPHINDVLKVAKDNTDYEKLTEYCENLELKVVGIVESPMCISVEGDVTNIGTGTVLLYVYVNRDFFDIEENTDIFLTVKRAKSLDTFSEKYEKRRNEAADALEALGNERIDARLKEIRPEAERRIDEAAELLESLKELERLEATVTKTATELPMIAKLEDEIASATEELEKLEDARWLIRTRDDSVGFESYSSNVGKVSALAKIFPVFFFIVALLVALTTVTRLIEEKRSEIGTLKAVGFSDGNILGEYMLYSMSASVLGCALGFGVGFKIFPYAISSAYSMMYFLPKTRLPIRVPIMLWVAPVTVGSILLATLLACYEEFRSCPAKLMIPKAPAAGKRIWLEHIPFIWKRLSFTYKVTFRNLFRYVKRFIMTIIGVAGCSALLVTGFGVRDSVNDIVDKQFGEIYKYQLTVLCTSQEAPDEDEKLSDFLKDKTSVESYLRCSSQEGKIEALEATKAEGVTLIVPENAEALSDFITLRYRKSGTEFNLPGKGLVITEKLSEEAGVAIGDTVELENADGKKALVRVEYITEHYVSSYAYLSSECYRELFDEAPEYSMLLVKVPEGAKNTVERVLESDSVIYARSSQSLRDTFDDSIKSINGVIWVLILAAGLLSVVVLYNLNNVNICERRKELATIRVLGFHLRETERYVFRESNILSFLGALVGQLVGIWLHSYVVRTVEVNHIMFGRDIYPLSFVYSIAITIGFSLLVNLIMKKNIRDIDMVEAMKANE